MKKIAVPITRNNQIEEHFGHSEFYEIYTFSSANEVLDLQLLETKKSRGCQSNLVNLLAKGGVTFMLSGRIGDKAVNKLNKAGIDVIRGCSGDSADTILQFIEGKVSDRAINCSEYDKKYRNEHAHLCSH